jgi:sugar phosphate permease
LRATTETAAGGAQGPSAVRYGVLAFSVAMAVILYLDRMAIAVPVGAIATDLDLTVTQVGDSVAAFFWCYALCQVPAGWLGDRFGGRRMLTLYVVAWSAATLGLGLAGGLVGLLAMRGLMGVGQAGAYATTASYLRRWMPAARRGLANSAVAMGGRAGAVIAPALTPVLMVWSAAAIGGVDRWRPVFFAYASVGFVWAAWFWIWFRDSPREHARCTAAEIALVEGVEQPAGETDLAKVSPGVAASVDDTTALATGRIPVVALLAHRGILFLSLIAFFINVGWIFLATWLPTYLIKVHGASETKAGFYTSLTAFAGMAGCLAGGAATDFLIARVGLVWGRRLPGIIAHGGAAMGLAGCWWLDSPSAIIVLLIASSFLGDFALGSIWASFQDIGGVYAGTVLGVSNMCGNIGAACAISAIGRIVVEYGWPPTFAMAASAYAIAAVGWMGVDPRVRIVAVRAAH